jgi:lysophospholipase L1-like esterase
LPNAIGRVRARLTPAKRIAGSVLLGLPAAAAGLLAAQMIIARRSIPVPQGPPPRGEMAYGPRSRRDPFTMVVLGDSFAAGYGVARSSETTGGLLAAGVARRLRRRVRLSILAVVGAESTDLRHQVDEALPLAPDLAVIFIGGNDVTQLSDHREPARLLGTAVRKLRRAGCEVVVGTCPDLSALPHCRPPLSWLARALSRRLAVAQREEVERAGGTVVSLAELLNPAFKADPDRLFGTDRFHPSAAGYALAAAVMLPAVLTVLRPAAAAAAARTATLPPRIPRQRRPEIGPGRSGTVHQPGEPAVPVENSDGRLAG